MGEVLYLGVVIDSKLEVIENISEESMPTPWQFVERLVKPEV